MNEAKIKEELERIRKALDDVLSERKRAASELSLLTDEKASKKKLREHEAAKKLGAFAKIELAILKLLRKDPEQAAALAEYEKALSDIASELEAEYGDAERSLGEKILLLDAAAEKLEAKQNEQRKSLMRELHSNHYIVIFEPSLVFSDAERRYTLSLDGDEYTYGKLSERRVLRIRLGEGAHELLWCVDGERELPPVRITADGNSLPSGARLHMSLSSPIFTPLDENELCAALAESDSHENTSSKEK